MAWVRTATSLITFGFTIYKFFDFLREHGTEFRPDRVLGPREFAMIMIGIGLVALALATVQHVQNTRALRREFPKVPISLATVLAALISVLGIMSFLAVLFRQ
jgi:inner membrane protein YidH